MADLKQLREERGQLDHKIKEVLERAESENRDLSAEEDKTYNELHERDMELKRRIERQEREEDRTRELAQVRDAGDLSPEEAAGAVGEDRGSETVTEEDRALALQAWCRSQSGLDLEDRHQEACQRLKFNPQVRNLDIQLSSGSQFRDMQRTALSKRSFEARDLEVGGTGATTIPQGFVRRLETALLAHGPMWQTSEVMRTADGAAMPYPTMNDTGNSAVLLAESTTIGTSTDPTMSSVTFNAYKYSSQPVLVSVEMLQDSAFDLSNVIADALGVRIARGTNSAFTSADGSSKPNGIVTAAAAGVTAAGAEAITADEVIDLYHSVDPAYRSDPSFGFMMHDSVVAVVRKLKDSDNQYLWGSGLNAGVPDTLLGAPVRVNQAMDDMGAGTDSGEDVMLCGAFAKYKIRQVRDIRMRRLVERYADLDQEAFIAFLRVDGDLVDAGTNPVKKLTLA
ncbi:MAG: phage major capsid protein [Planctomycetaceae bacterium]|nr:phage major capsid protein [Planctomycetaceae bacterium]